MEGTYAYGQTAEVGAAKSRFQHITPFSYSILVSRFAVLGNVAVAVEVVAILPSTAPWGNILLLWNHDSCKYVRTEAVTSFSF